MSELIDWGATGQILLESVVAGVLIVAAFSSGRGWSPWGRRTVPPAAARPPLWAPPACFLVAAAAVGFGVWFTVDK